MRTFCVLPFLLPVALSHMQMIDPSPLRDPHSKRADEPKDYNILTPLKGDGSDFTCKGYQWNTPLTTVATYEAGKTYTMKLQGGATHGGGSCQISLSCDNGLHFKVLESIIGGCPLLDSYEFTVPRFVESAQCLLAWTWFNKIGNREMYMNCAVVDIVGARTKASRRQLLHRATSATAQMALSSLPDMFVANLKGINDCTTKESVDASFDDPGSSVAYGDGLKAGGSTGKKGACVGVGRNSGSGPLPALPDGGASGGDGGNSGPSSGSSGSTNCYSDGQYHPNGCSASSSQSSKISNLNGNAKPTSSPPAAQPVVNSKTSSKVKSSSSEPSSKIEAELDANGHSKSGKNNSPPSSSDNKSPKKEDPKPAPAPAPAPKKEKNLSSGKHDRNNELGDFYNLGTDDTANAGQVKDSYKYHDETLPHSGYEDNDAYDYDDETYLRQQQSLESEEAPAGEDSSKYLSALSVGPDQRKLPEPQGHEWDSKSEDLSEQGQDHHHDHHKKCKKPIWNCRGCRSPNRCVRKKGTCMRTCSHFTYWSTTTTSSTLYPSSRSTTPISTPVGPTTTTSFTTSATTSMTVTSEPASSTAQFTVPSPTTPTYVTGDPNVFLPCKPGSFLCKSSTEFQTCGQFGRGWTYGALRQVAAGMECKPQLDPGQAKAKRNFGWWISAGQNQNSGNGDTANPLQDILDSLDVLGKSFHKILDFFNEDAGEDVDDDSSWEGWRLIKRRIGWWLSSGGNQNNANFDKPWIGDTVDQTNPLVNVTENIDALDHIVNTLLSYYPSSPTLKTLKRGFGWWLSFGGDRVGSNGKAEKDPLIPILEKLKNLIKKVEKLKAFIDGEGKENKGKRSWGFWGSSGYDALPAERKQEKLDPFKPILAKIHRLSELAKDLLNSCSIDGEDAGNDEGGDGWEWDYTKRGLEKRHSYDDERTQVLDGVVGFSDKEDGGDGSDTAGADVSLSVVDPDPEDATLRQSSSIDDGTAFHDVDSSSPQTFDPVESGEYPDPVEDDLDSWERKFAKRHAERLSSEILKGGDGIEDAPQAAIDEEPHGSIILPAAAGDLEDALEALFGSATPLTDVRPDDEEDTRLEALFSTPSESFYGDSEAFPDANEFDEDTAPVDTLSLLSTFDEDPTATNTFDLFSQFEGRRLRKRQDADGELAEDLEFSEGEDGGDGIYGPALDELEDLLEHDRDGIYGPALDEIDDLFGRAVAVTMKSKDIKAEDSYTEDTVERKNEYGSAGVDGDSFEELDGSAAQAFDRRQASPAASNSTKAKSSKEAGEGTDDDPNSLFGPEPANYEKEWPVSEAARPSSSPAAAPKEKSKASKPPAEVVAKAKSKNKTAPKPTSTAKGGKAAAEPPMLKVVMERRAPNSTKPSTKSSKGAGEGTEDDPIALFGPEPANYETEWPVSAEAAQSSETTAAAPMAKSKATKPVLAKTSAKSKPAPNSTPAAKGGKNAAKPLTSKKAVMEKSEAVRRWAKVPSYSPAGAIKAKSIPSKPPPSKVNARAKAKDKPTHKSRPMAKGGKTAYKPEPPITKGGKAVHRPHLTHQGVKAPHKPWPPKNITMEHKPWPLKNATMEHKKPWPPKNVTIEHKPWSPKNVTMEHKPRPPSSATIEKRQASEPEAEVGHVVVGKITAPTPVWEVPTDESTSPNHALNLKAPASAPAAKAFPQVTVKHAAKSVGKISPALASRPPVDEGPGPRPQINADPGDGTEDDPTSLFPNIHTPDSMYDGLENTDSKSGYDDPVDDAVAAKRVLRSSVKVLVNPLRPTETAIVGSKKLISTLASTKTSMGAFTATSVSSTVAISTSVPITVARSTSTHTSRYMSTSTLSPTTSGGTKEGSDDEYEWEYEEYQDVEGPEKKGASGSSEKNDAGADWHDGILFSAGSKRSPSHTIPTPILTTPTTSKPIAASFFPYFFGPGPVVPSGVSISWPGPEGLKDTAKPSYSTPSVAVPSVATSGVWPPTLSGVTVSWPPPLPGVTTAARVKRSVNRVEKMKVVMKLMDARRTAEGNSCPLIPYGHYRDDQDVTREC